MCVPNLIQEKCVPEGKGLGSFFLYSRFEIIDLDAWFRNSRDLYGFCISYEFGLYYRCSEG